jgi:uroporphyrinogen III methyltransferase/synthase
VLIVRAAGGRDLLPDALAARGDEVETLEVYETVPEAGSPALLERALGADYITFTSASTVRNLLAATGGAGALRATARLVSIGPVTSAALREHGLEPDVEALRHDIDGLVEALLADVAGAPSQAGAKQSAE